MDSGSNSSSSSICSTSIISGNSNSGSGAALGGNSMFNGSLAGLNCKAFKQLLDAQSLVDCTLACDGGKISAHKIVLSACSSYLAKILLEHPVEHPIIILPELSIEDVRTLIHYMYTGDLLKSNTINSISLLRTAAILSINSLNDLLLSQAPPSTSPLAPGANHLFGLSPSLMQHSHHQQQQQQQLLTNENHLTTPSSLIIQQQQHQQRQQLQQREQQQQQQQQQGVSLVDQISPLLAAFTQQHQYKLQLQQQLNAGLGNQTQAEEAIRGSSSSSSNSGGGGSSSSSSSIVPRLAGNSNSVESTNNSFNNLIGAAAALGNGAGISSPTKDATTMYYNSLTNLAAASAAVAVAAAANNNNNNNSGSGSNNNSNSTPSLTSSTPSSPSNNNSTGGATLQLRPQSGSSSTITNTLKPEPFAYSTAITGTTSLLTRGSSSSDSPSSPSSSSSPLANGNVAAAPSEYQFKCPTCQNHFQTICSFEYHMQRAHSVASFGCEICHKPFASLRYVLTDHMRRCHGWKVGNNGLPSNLISQRGGQQKIQC